MRQSPTKKILFTLLFCLQIFFFSFSTPRAEAFCLFGWGSTCTSSSQTPTVTEPAKPEVNPSTNSPVVSNDTTNNGSQTSAGPTNTVAPATTQLAPATQNNSDSLIYVPLAPLTPNPSGQAIDLGAYLPFMFNLLIGVSALLAIVMIVIGGVTYITTDVFSQKSSSKSIIYNAVLGLLLVISSYMILYTINPDLLKFQLRFKTLNHGGWNTGAGAHVLSPGATCEGSDCLQISQGEQTNRTILNEAGININTNPCTGTTVVGCTDVGGTKVALINDIIVMKNEACGFGTNPSCSVTISGGSEAHPGYATDPHATGDAVDVRIGTGFDTYMRSTFGIPPDATPNQSHYYYGIVGGQPVSVLYEQNHWHIQINKTQ